MGDSQTRLKRAGAPYPHNSSARLTKLEHSSPVMRRALVMVVLLFLPAVHAYVAPASPIEDDQHLAAGEIVLELAEGVWTHQAWVQLQEEGLVPLRVLSPTQLVAWGHPSDAAGHLVILPSPEAAWNDGDSDLPLSAGDEVRILLEPRLPADAYEGVRSQLALLGIEIGTQYSPTPLASVHMIEWPLELSLDRVLGMDGLLWIEPVLATEARNVQAAALLQDGAFTGHPAWHLGINGNGVVVGAADSGLDADHACFRNATAAGEIGSSGENGTDLLGDVGQEHRKLLALNTSIDAGDTQGHSDYRHGTHVAGSLSCFNVDDARNGHFPSNGSALAHQSLLVFQDIVSEDGWVPPDVDRLLVEAGLHGAVIHSNSWGDDTTAYTARTADFDAWALAMPWSLAFIAPGNTGSSLLEPANGRNVAAIGASMKSEDGERWSSSSIGPTEADTNGIFALAVGTSIQSAKADNLPTSYNGDLRTSTGTSMATPMAAGVAALIQQMVEEGWVSGQESRANTSMDLMAPGWLDDESYANSTLSVGPGFTPSGPMLRALLALSTTPLPDEQRDGGSGDNSLQNVHDGWGQLNLSALIDLEILADELGQGHASPADDVWIHDTFRLSNSTPEAWLTERQGAEGPLENLIAAPWNGDGAVGPFLRTGEAWTQRFTLVPGVDFEARMAHIASPEPTAVNDLQLVARLSDGRIAIGGVENSNGGATLHYSSTDLDNRSSFPATNETTHGLRLDAATLADVDWIEIEVRARFVAPGNNADGVGLDGTRTGFGLALKGVERDAQDWNDGDGDGVANIEDVCPNQNASGWDENNDGCLDDTDGDGVVDNLDDCPDQNASQYDDDSNGCLDDTDGDGVADDVDVCLTLAVDELWPVDAVGCRPLDVPPMVSNLTGPSNGSQWDGNLTVQWSIIDVDGDGFVTGANVVVLDNHTNNSGYSIASCEREGNSSASLECVWASSESLPLWSIESSLLRIEVFVQSTNASPEADTNRILIQSSDRFTAKYDAPFTDIDVTDPPEVQGEGAQIRALAWGVVGLVAVGVAIFRLGVQGMRSEKQEHVAPAFPMTEPGTGSSRLNEKE